MQWTVTIPVQADQRYCYRIYRGSTDLLGTMPSPEFRAALAPGSTQPFSFAVVGSFGYPTADEDPAQQALATSVARGPSRFIMGSGGVAYTGAQVDYGDLVRPGAGVFERGYWSEPGMSMPIFPAESNKGAFFPFVTNWKVTKTLQASGGVSKIDTYCCVNGSREQNLASVWYAFSFGRARFYVLDAAWPNGNVGTGSIYENDWIEHFQPDTPQYQWLANGLASRPVELKFAFFNFPLADDGK